MINYSVIFIRALFIICIATLFNSCLSFIKSEKDDCDISFITIPSDIVLVACSHQIQGPDFTTPSYYYLKLKADKKLLVNYFDSLGLIQFSEEAVKTNSMELLNIYGGKKLWSFVGAYLYEPIGISDWWKPNQDSSNYYANYSLVGKKATIGVPKSDYNGKIVANVQDSICFLYIEELFLAEAVENYSKYYPRDSNQIK